MFNKCSIPFSFKYNYDRLLVYGMSGSGKTYLVKKIIECLREEGYHYKVFNGNIADYNKNDLFDTVMYDPLKSINDFMQYAIQNAPITLVFEDITTIFYSTKIPRLFQALLFTGRRIGIGFIFITHRVRRVPSIILSNSNKIVLFKPSDKRDLDVLAIPDITKNVYELQKYQFIFYNVENGDYYIAKV